MMCTLAAADNYRAHGVCSLTLSPYPASASLTIVFNCVHRCNQFEGYPLQYNSLFSTSNENVQVEYMIQL